jgi:hypothetical protein
MGERLSTTRCPKAYARPHPRQRMPRLALPAPHNGRTWPTVPHLLASCTQRRSGQVCTETFLLRFQAVLHPLCPLLSAEDWCLRGVAQEYTAPMQGSHKSLVKLRSDYGQYCGQNLGQPYQGFLRNPCICHAWHMHVAQFIILCSA